MMWKWGLVAGSSLVVATATAAPDACDGFGLLEGSLTIDESDFSMSGDAANDFFGRSMLTADINGDGSPDVVVGAPGADAMGLDSGGAYIFYGPFGDLSDLSPATADVTIKATGQYDYLGWTLSPVGDLDLDGYPDVVIGAPANPSSGFPAGYALLINGGPSLPAVIAAEDADAVFMGGTAGDQFGFSVANVLDMNGDGFNDVAVGAPGNDQSANNAGAVFVFPGPITGTLFADEADAVITGPTSGALTGWSVSSLGDFDSDGVMDIAVGSPKDRRGGFFAGSASVVFGDIDFDISTNLASEDLRSSSFLGSPGSRFGTSVAGVYDLTGDDVPDIAVSAPNDDANGVKSGAVYMIPGAAYGPTELAASRWRVRWTGSAAYEGLGSSMSASDVNGDGEIDVAVGAETATDGVTNASGLVYVKYGPFLDLDDYDMADADVTISGNQYRGYVGSALASSDLNDDGYSDLLVGGWRHDGAAAHSGVIGVFFGGEDVSDLTTWYLDADSDTYGDANVTVVSCTKPYGFSANADDCDDGAYFTHPGADESCDNGGDTNCDGHVGDGDFDGDGYAACDDCNDGDPLVHPDRVELCDNVDWNCDGDTELGAPTALDWYFDLDGDGFGAEATALRGCSKPGGVVVDLIHTGGDCDDYAADVNPGEYERCDGVDEDCSGVADDGAVDAPYWFADADGDTFGDYGTTTRDCTQPNGYVSNAEDCDDLDPARRPGAQETCNLVDDDCNGLHYLGGDQDAPDAAHITVFGASAEGRTGDAVAFLGDQNADGSDEIVIGVPNDDTYGVDAGAVYITYGRAHRDIVDLALAGAETDAAPYARIYSDPRRGQFGQVITTGDFNGDGIDDLAAAAPMDNLAGAQSGRVYVFFGPLVGDHFTEDADLTYDAAARHSWTGGALASVDLDNDGYDELVIGAPRFSQGTAYRGGAFIVYGATDMVSGNLASGDADAWFLGEDANHELGSALANAGDVNHDGFDDLALGAPEADARTGRAYVIYGSAGRTGGRILDADVTFTGETVFDRLGTSIAGVGDFDGDGMDDLAFGSSYRRTWVVNGGALVSGPIGDRSDLVMVGLASQAAGRAVSAAGDVNGDGNADMIVSAMHDEDGGVDAGAAYVVYGGQAWDEATAEYEGVSLDGVESFGEFVDEPTDDAPLLSAQNTAQYEGAKLRGARPATFAGTAIAGGGDLNGDGNPDVLIGAPRLLNGAADTVVGGVWGFLGDGYGMDVSADDPIWYQWDRDMDGYSHYSDGMTLCPVHAPWEFDSGRRRAWSDWARFLDCNDDDPAINPDAIDYVGDGVDSDCRPDVNDPPLVTACDMTEAGVEGTAASWYAVAEGVDPEGAPINWTYVWERTRDAVTEVVSTSATLDSSLTQRSDRLQVHCTATDHLGLTDADVSPSHVVPNSPPGMPGVSLVSVDDLGVPTGLGLNEWEAVLCDDVSAPIDDDGDPVARAYVWLVDDVVMGGGSPAGSTGMATTTHFPGDTLMEAAATGLQTVECRLNLFDGLDSSPDTYTAVGVIDDDLPPTEPIVRVVPNHPEEGRDDLHCQIVIPSVDPEGADVTHTFSWLHNGEPYAGPTLSTWYAGDTIPRTETTAAETWTCRVVGHDGTQEGLDDIHQVVVRNVYEGVVVTAGHGHVCGRTPSGFISCWGGDNVMGQLVPPSGEAFVDHASGWFHNCAIRESDGRAVCWGDNTYGQADPPASVFVSVTAGANHSCGVSPDGESICWGDNSHGQLNAPADNFSKIDAGAYHTCGVTESGGDPVVRCWGSDTFGESVVSGDGFDGVTAGTNTTCLLDSTIGDVYCVGAYETTLAYDGYSGVDAGGYTWCGIAETTDGGVDCENTPWTWPDHITNWDHLSTGVNVACGVTTTSMVHCWGDEDRAPDFTDPNPPAAPELCDGFDNNGDGQIDEGLVGCDANIAPPAPGVRVSPDTIVWGLDDVQCQVTQASVDPDGDDVTYDFRFYVTYDTVPARSSDVFSGTDLISTVYPNDTLPMAALLPVGVYPDSATVQCSATPNDGTVDGPAGWSSNLVPATAYPPAPGAVSIEAGQNHACALYGDGSLSCWGRNTDGQSTPQANANGYDYVEVDGGRSHTCALDTNGDLTCWGRNNEGQAPDLAWGDITSFSTGDNHTCVVSAGEVHCVGANGNGQTVAPLGSNWIQVSAGRNHTCALNSLQEVVCWGGNNEGQSDVPPFGVFTSINAGVARTCADTNVDGEVWCWGDITNVMPAPYEAGTWDLDEAWCGIHQATGQIGCEEGPTVSPVPNPAMDWVEVAVGQTWGCALRETGDIRCWGQMDYGQDNPPPPIGGGGAPGSAGETCDLIDNDGDGLVDEGMADADGDGLCDDMDSEDCGDGIDNDGDGWIDESCAPACPRVMDYETDAEGDPILPGQDTRHVYDGEWGVEFHLWPDDTRSWHAKSTAFDSGDLPISGDDADLGTPNEVFGGPGIGLAGETTNDVYLGNLLIRQDGTKFDDLDGDGRFDEPNDHPGGSFYEWLFTEPACVHHVKVVDVASDAYTRVTVTMSDSSEMWEVPGIGANGVQDLVIDRCDVVGITLGFQESVGVGEVSFCPSGAVEVCDGLDNDGDGLTDEGFADSDGDGVMNCIDDDNFAAEADCELGHSPHYGDLIITNQAEMNAVCSGTMTSVVGDILIGGWSGNDITTTQPMSCITCVDGSVVFNTNATANVDIGLSNIEAVTGSVMLYDDSGFLSWRWPSLEYIGGNLVIERVSSLSAPSGTLLPNTFPVLQEIGGTMLIKSNSSLERIRAFPSLGRIDGDMIVRNNNAVSEIDIGYPNLQRVGGNVLVINNPTLDSAVVLDWLTSPVERISVGGTLTVQDNL